MRILKKIGSRFTHLSPGVKASIAFTVCSVLQKGIQFFTVPVFTRIMSDSEYGQYNLYQTWHSIILIVATLNLSAGVFNNGMMKYPDKRSQYTSSMQTLSTCITLCVFSIYILFHNMFNDLFGLPTIVMIAMFAQLMFSPAFSFWSARQRYEFKYKALVLFTLLLAVLDSFTGLIFVTNSSSKGIARILSVCLVNIVVGFIFYILNYIRGKEYYNKEYWKYALAFNLPLVPHYLSQIVLAQSDRIMIERMCGTATVAYYSVAYSIGMIMSIVVTSIHASFVPWTYETMKQHNYSELRRISNGLVLLMAIVTMTPIVFAPEVISILAPSNYQQAIWVVAPVAVSSLMTFIYTLFANIEFYYEKSKFVMTASLIAALSNIVLNYIFIKLFGFIAAGYTTLFCYILLCIMHYLFMKKTIKSSGVAEKEIYSLTFITGTSVSVCSLAAIFMLTYKMLVLRLIMLLVVITVIYIKRNYFLHLLRTIKKRS